MEPVNHQTNPSETTLKTPLTSTHKKPPISSRRSDISYSLTPSRTLCANQTVENRRLSVITPVKNFETDNLTLQQWMSRTRALEKQLAIANKQLEAKENTIKINSVKTSKLEEQIRNLQEDIKSGNSEKAILKKEIADLKGKLAAKQRSAYEVKVKTLEYESSQSQEAITILKNQIEALTNDKNLCVKEKELLEEKNKELEKSLSSFEDLVVSLQDEKKKVDQETLVFQTKSNEICKGYDILKRDYERVIEDCASLKKQLDFKEESSINKDKEITKLLTDLNKYRTDIAKLQVNLEHYKTEMSKKDQSLEYLSNELNSSKSKVETLLKDIDQTSARLFKVTSEYSLLTDQYQVSISNAEKIRDELALSKQEVSQQQGIIEEQRSQLKLLQGIKIQDHSELQRCRADLNRLDFMTNHLKEEKQSALREIEYLKSIIEANGKDMTSINQILSIERLANNELKNQITVQANEIITLKSQIEDFKYREASSQSKSDDKLTALQSENNSLRLAKSDLELKIAELETKRLKHEEELSQQADILKLQYEQQLVDLEINRTDSKKNCAHLTYELSLSQREIERLKDRLKSREVKIEQQKEHLRRVSALEDLTTQLKEQLSQKENAFATLQNKNKQLQSLITSSQHQNSELFKLKEENEKLVRKLEESEWEIRTLVEKNKVCSLQIEELLLKDQNLQPMNDKQKMDWITKLRKENLELKQELTKVKEQHRQTQIKLRQKQNTCSVAKIKQSLPPPPN